MMLYRGLVQQLDLRGKIPDLSMRRQGLPGSPLLSVLACQSTVVLPYPLQWHPIDWLISYPPPKGHRSFHDSPCASPGWSLTRPEVLLAPQEWCVAGADQQRRAGARPHGPRGAH